MKTKDRLQKLLERHHQPLTELQLRRKLGQNGRLVNKTTVYRSLEQLLKLNLIKPVDFGDGKKRFEANHHQHHHHLVCSNCSSIEDIYVHNDVKHVEDKIRKQTRFLVQSHSLEFFGLCAQCLNQLI